MGYSGSDDFDVTPLLRSIKTQRRLIWVNHSNDKMDITIRKLTDINIHEISNDNNLYHTFQLLTDLCKIGAWEKDNIFFVKANTKLFLSSLMDLNKIPKIESTGINKWDSDTYFENWAQMHLTSGGLREFAIGLLFVEIGAYIDAATMFHFALQNISEDDIKLKRKICFSLGSVYALMGEYQLAEKYGKDAITYPGTSDLFDTLATFELTGKIALYQGKYDVAKGYLDEVVRIATENYMLPYLANGLHYLGRVWHAKRNFEKAFECYSNAAQLYSELGHIQANALSFHQLGVLYQDQKNFKKAIEYYDKSLNTDFRERFGR